MDAPPAESNNQLPTQQPPPAVVEDNTQSALKSPISPEPPKKSNFPWVLLIILMALISFSISGYLLFGVKSQISKPLSQLPTSGTPQTIPKVTPTITPVTLSLESPMEGDLISGNEITVKGKTIPNATVAIYSENSENVVESDASGNFETKVTLAIGINSLNVTAFSDSGEEKSITVNIVRDN